VKRIIYALCLTAAITVVIAGCGSSGENSSGGAYGGKGGGGGSKPAAETSEAGSKGAYGESSGGEGSGGGDGIVAAGKAGDLGVVLVDSEGRTLYDFHKDKGSKSACYDACASGWPPLLTEGNPQAQGAADRSLLGTTKRNDGTLQVTYNGWPLYTYAGDQKPGEANGNDVKAFGAQWYALMPNGEEPGD
jgi:predicted lipoprotein with Yx(FWY)xxD motif